mgnify:CR=1 FL=1
MLVRVNVWTYVCVAVRQVGPVVGDLGRRAGQVNGNAVRAGEAAERAHIVHRCRKVLRAR